MASPDINTEDFQAAVDTRIKATVVSTMHDMFRVNANGYFDAENSVDARYARKEAMNAQRPEDTAGTEGTADTEGTSGTENQDDQNQTAETGSTQLEVRFGHGGEAYILTLLDNDTECCSITIFPAGMISHLTIRRL